MKPVIAIPQMGNDLFRIYMKSKYVQSLKRAGAKVRWIELGNTEQAVRETLQCDGLLLPGGADIAPTYYAQEPTAQCGKPNPLRDTAERKMLEAFLPTGKPIFCICRGVQLLNVFCGGTLFQDIKGSQKCRHSDFPSRAKGCHGITVTEGTRLRAILGVSRLKVNSMHHQAADAVGRALAVSAVSEDGFVEALEMPGHPFCLGVQWHPEHMRKGSRIQQHLFDSFVGACQKEAY